MAITAAEARRNLGQIIDQVNIDGSAVEIISEAGSAVMLSKREFDALTETNYLLRSPKNAQRLLTAMQSARRADDAAHDSGRTH